MNWLVGAIVLTCAAICAAIIAGATQLWLVERRRREVFPAANASALLNPLRWLIQRPESVIAALGLRRGDIVLELGSGPGYFSASAAAAVSPGGRLICLDVQPEMLRLLSARLASTGATAHVDLIAADATSLPFRADAIDAAYLVSVLGEIPDQTAAIRDIVRVVRPRGSVSFCETVNDPDFVRLPALRALCSRAGLDPRAWRRQLLGHIASFSKPSTPQSPRRT